NPTLFARFQGDLADAEGHSHVTPSQAGQLAQDEAALDGAIRSAGLDANTTATDLDQVQDAVADAFRETPAELAKERISLDQDLAGIAGGPHLVRRAIAQMQVDSRATRLTSASREALATDWQGLESGVAGAATAGAGDRHPLQVFYDGQVGQFMVPVHTP